MKTGIVTDYLDRYGVKEGLARMKRHGYSYADYQGFLHTEDEIFRVDEATFAGRLTGLRRAAEAAGIGFWQCHAPWRCPPRDATGEDRAERVAAMKKSVYGTHLLGSSYFVVHPLMPFGAGENPDEAAFFAVNRAFFTELCDYAASLGVVVCLENMPFGRLPLSTPAQVVRFVRELGIGNLKVCLDTGHCNVFGIRSGDAVREIGGELLATLHVHDNDGRGDLHWQPFTGTVDWEDFRAALREVGFSGVLSLETVVPDRVPAALREYEEIGLSRKAAYLAN